jgi:hypothetical protein
VSEPVPVPKPEPVSAPAAEEALMAPEVVANELARLRRRNRVAIAVSIFALLALPFACAM